MKNKIEDLRNILFEQLERLNDNEDMKNPLKLEKELQRAGAIAEVANVIVNSAKAETDYLRLAGGSPKSDFIPIVGNQPQQISEGTK